jgi:hypothetical protein
MVETTLLGSVKPPWQVLLNEEGLTSAFRLTELANSPETYNLK